MGRTPTTDSAESTAFAPGRVNLIGEHTDYNDGLALAFAISAGVHVAARARPRSGWCRVHALDLGESDSFLISDPPATPGWRAFVRGMVAELGAAGIDIPGCELAISGHLPRGAGLSSSAALEVALGLSLLGLAGQALADDIALARLCSRVENTWVGAQSGLLDQLTSLCAQADRALLIDFASLDLSEVRLELGEYTLVAVDSGQTHSISESGYNRRREECAEACVALGVTSLREATFAGVAELADPLRRRARHVLSENRRVREAVDALNAGDLARLGSLLSASHASLRDDYEVSTDQVEATVDRLMAQGAVGARIMGGGFGGSVLALLAPGVPAPEDAIILEAGPGAHLVSTGARA